MRGQPWLLHATLTVVVILLLAALLLALVGAHGDGYPIFPTLPGGRA